MQGKNLFERPEERNRKGMNTALILFLVGILGIFLIFYVGNQVEKGRQPLKDLHQAQNKLVEARLVWADYAFAEGGSDKRYYHIAQLEDYSLVALSLTKDSHQRITALIDKDSDLADWEQHPYVVSGLVEATSQDLRPFLAERHSEYELEEDEHMAATDPRLLLMVTEGKRPFASYWPYALLLPGIMGLAMLIDASGNRKALRRARDTVAQALPVGFEPEKLDEAAQLAIPELKLRVVEPLLISEGRRLDVMDLTQVGWMYQRTIRHYFVATNSFLQVHTNNKKLTQIALPGQPKKAGEALTQLWAYLAEHHPDIQLGFGKEQRNQYKDSTKA